MKFGVIGLDEKRPSDSIEVPTQWALLIMSMYFPGANIIQNDGIFETKFRPEFWSKLQSPLCGIGLHFLGLSRP